LGRRRCSFQESRRDDAARSRSSHKEIVTFVSTAGGIVTTAAPVCGRKERRCVDVLEQGAKPAEDALDCFYFVQNVLPLNPFAQTAQSAAPLRLCNQRFSIKVEHVLLDVSSLAVELADSRRPVRALLDNPTTTNLN
jgi:hypothetical protein